MGKTQLLYSVFIRYLRRSQRNGTLSRIKNAFVANEHLFELLDTRLMGSDFSVENAFRIEFFNGAKIKTSIARDHKFFMNGDRDGRSV